MRCCQWRGVLGNVSRAPGVCPRPAVCFGITQGWVAALCEHPLGFGEGSHWNGSRHSVGLLIEQIAMSATGAGGHAGTPEGDGGGGGKASKGQGCSGVNHSHHLCSEESSRRCHDFGKPQTTECGSCLFLNCSITT